MAAAVGAILLFVNFEPGFVFNCMSAVTAVLTPNYQPFAESPFANHTQQVALALSF